MTFTKKDALKALSLGFFVSLMLLVIVKNLDFNLPINKYWLVFILPALSSLGLYITYRISLVWKPFIYQFGKFFVVGLSNTFLDLGVLNFLIYITNITNGFYLAVFKLTSFICALINSFFWNKNWTFGKQGNFLAFILVVSASSLLNVAWTSYMVDVVGAPDGISPKLWDNISALSSIFLVLTWNFLGLKFIVFKKKPEA